MHDDVPTPEASADVQLMFEADKLLERRVAQVIVQLFGPTYGAPTVQAQMNRSRFLLLLLSTPNKQGTDKLFSMLREEINAAVAAQVSSLSAALEREIRKNISNAPKGPTTRRGKK